MKLSVVIPVFNEEATIEELVSLVLGVDYPCDIEVILIDDCSQDSTYEKLREISRCETRGKISVFQNEVNMGKGSAIRNGLTHATGDIVIVQDADTEYNPEEIPKLITPILEGQVEAVYGSRFKGVWRPEGMGFLSWAANRTLTTMTNLLYGGKLTDMETCYKAVKASLIKKMKLRCTRFDFEPELTTQLLKRKIKILELPITYVGRSAKEGKKIKGRDFVHAVGTLTHRKFSSNINRRLIRREANKIALKSGKDIKGRDFFQAAWLLLRDRFFSKS